MCVEGGGWLHKEAELSLDQRENDSVCGDAETL